MSTPLRVGTSPADLDHRSLYRLPWSFSDNVIAWLEPTSKCNLACEGCYRSNEDRHKSLDEVRADLDVFRKYRTFDGVSIAGGDPLMHPQIVDIVRIVTERGWKAVLNTNGLALKPELLRALKGAGLVGLTFHIDSKQGRPGWRGKSEVELNDLRLEYAEMAAEVGVSCAFNSTVYQDTLEQVPELVEWAHRHIDVVHVMVFIAYRQAVRGEFDYFHGAEKIDVQPLKYVIPDKRQRLDISSREVVGAIRTRFPDFMPAAYLGGTEMPHSFKWLMAGRLGTKEKIFGYVGPRMMEATQSAHHFLTGRYLAYAPPAALEAGRSTMALAAIDGGTRAALREYLGWIAERPRRALDKVHYQSILCIQPIDLLPDGRQNMCDGCPDITVHDGELVWSCRLEERLNYGAFLRTAPNQGGGCARGM